MGEGSYNKHGLTQYLLGMLPEPEAERFDELSLTDDEFAEALKVAENDLVDAYAQGELAGEAMEQFKAHYLASPLRREKVKFSQAFQAFAEQNPGLASEGIEAESPQKARKRGGWFSGLGAFFAPRHAFQWGLTVAALALLVAGSWLAFENMRLRQQMTQAQVNRDALLQREQQLQKEIETQRSASSQTEQELARVRDERERLDQELKQARGEAKPTPVAGSIVALILAPPLRGASQLPTITVKPDTSQVAASLQLETAADYPAYRVALIDPARKQTLWRSGTLKPRVRGGRKSIEASFRTDFLKPQNYILEVTGISGSASEVVGDYPFRVVK